MNVQTHVGFKDRFRYIFTRKGDDWRLSKRQIFDEISDGWKSHHI
ncbi:NTF2 fold immunity protein [Sphingomonas sp. Leaf23]